MNMIRRVIRPDMRFGVGRGRRWGLLPVLAIALAGAAAGIFEQPARAQQGSAQQTGAQQASPRQALLKRALELAPEADADKNGELSAVEVLKYAESHPEIKQLLGAKPRESGQPPPPPLTDLPLDGTGGGGPAFDPAVGPRHFVCSHSFMIFTAEILPRLAQAGKVPYVAAGRQMLGGSRVIRHWDLPDEQNKAKQALAEGKVDVLTLSPHFLLPDEGIDYFTTLGLGKNPRLRVLVQASWPARDGMLLGNFRNEDRNEATVESLESLRAGFGGAWLNPLEKQIKDLNQRVGRDAVFIIPVSEAVFALRKKIAEGKAPGLAKQTDLFRDDLGHPLPPLALLVSYCHYATVLGRSPVGLPVPSELNGIAQAPTLNRLLQEIAWNAVTGYALSGVKENSESPIPSGQ